MGSVIMHNVVSVDGFIADQNDDVVRSSTGTPTVHPDHRGRRTSPPHARRRATVPGAMWESIGVIVMGRHLFDLVNGWGGWPPAGDHIVVVSHRPKP